MKIYQALFLAAAVATNVVSAATTTHALPSIPSKPADWTRPDGATGRPDGVTGLPDFSKPADWTRPDGVTDRPSKPDGDKPDDRTHPDGVTDRPSKPDGDKPDDQTRPDGVTDRPSKPDGDKPDDRTHPDGVTDRPSKPDGDKPDDRPDCLTAEGLDDRAKQYCCFKGVFTGDEKCPEGDKDRVSVMCEKGHSTTMAAATSILDEVKNGLACRPIRNENTGEGDKEDGKSGKPQAEDPRRNTQALAEKAKDLLARGKKCVSNLKLAIESVKTLMQQWNGEPTRKPRKDANELSKDTVADTFHDAVEVAVGAEKLNKDFAEEHIGSTTEELLPAKEGDDGAPKQCKAEWGAFKEELGELVEGFKQIPAKFKEAKARTVQIALKDIDLGAVDWTSEQDVCSFSEGLVTKMKEVQKSLSTKLHRIRGALCTEGSKLAAGPKVGALARCLREKRKSNPEDVDANDEVYGRIRAKTNKIFAQIHSKCVAKPKDGDDNAEDGDDNAEAVQPSTKTKRTIGMRIRKACGAAENKQECKDRVIAKIKEAFKAKNPDAEVEVSVTDDSANIRGRRLSDGALAAQVTLTQTGAPPNPDYEGGVVAALGTAEVETTSDSTEGTETITPPADLNMDIGDPAPTTKASLRTEASTDSAARVAMGAAAAVFVALVSVLL